MKQTILNTISDLCSDLIYYDRKEDEELSREQLNEAVKSGEITVDEMVAEFRKHLEATYGSQTVAYTETKEGSNLPIFSVSECLTYLNERLKLANHNLNETEVERNYFRCIGQVSELETVIEHIEAELNIR